MSKPQRTIILARISDARDGDDHGVAAQLSDLRRHAKRLDWKVGPAVTHEITENDTSAFKRRKVCRSCLQPARACTCPPLPDGQKRETVLRTWRPGFRRALAMLADGSADAMIALDLDRACRDPRDLEDLIDIAESRHPLVPIESITGSLRLASDADVTMARVMVAMANKSSRDTARRVAAARERKALAGEYGGGVRCFGYTADGLSLVEPEASLIAAAADLVLAGASLRSIVRDWAAAGFTTTSGNPWRPSWLRSLLMRPRLAGIAVYRGEEIGAAAWPPILDEATWRSVCRLLADPGRYSARGNEPKWLGSNLYLCGLCDDLVTTGTGGRYERSYVCTRNHMRRAAAQVDAIVSGVIAERLARPDAAVAVAPRQDGGPDTAALHRQAAALRSRLDELAALHARGQVTGAQLATGSKIIRDELAEAERQLATVATVSPLAGIAGSPDAAAIWMALPLWRQREIVRLLTDVRLMPSRRGRQPGGGYFDPNSVVIEWKRG